MIELGMPTSKISLSENYDKHAFEKTYPKEILTFLWNALEYGELKEAGDWEASPSPGTFTTFNQREFYPDTTDWENDGNFKNRENGWVYIPNQCYDT